MTPCTYTQQSMLFWNANFILITHPLAQLVEERDEERVTVILNMVCVMVQEIVYKWKKRILKSPDSLLEFKDVKFGWGFTITLYSVIMCNISRLLQGLFKIYQFFSISNQFYFLLIHSKNVTVIRKMKVNTFCK